MRRRYRDRYGRWRWEDDDGRRPIEISFNFGKSTSRTETTQYYDEEGRKVVRTTTTTASDGLTPGRLFDALKVAFQRAKEVVLDPDAPRTDADPGHDAEPAATEGDGIDVDTGDDAPRG